MVIGNMKEILESWLAASGKTLEMFKAISRSVFLSVISSMFPKQFGHNMSQFLV